MGWTKALCAEWRNDRKLNKNALPEVPTTTSEVRPEYIRQASYLRE